LLKANPPLQNVCPIINCEHFYILSVEHYVSPFLQKEIVQKCYKRYDYLKGLESNKPTKEIAYIYCKNSTNYYFLLLKRILKKKLIIWHPSAKPEKVLQ